ncbi:MAG: RluA family pseudouridine synthase [Candidatus Omnitrophica bacterium]|nr:RluA family pseudouridine synthase [Candidatus Omnitrophota bacterium]
METHRLKAQEKDNNKRLDLFLVENLTADYSRSFVQRLILKGHASVNDTVVKRHARIKKGDLVVFTVPPPVETRISAEDIPLNIVFEDDHLIVIDKPAGMVVHPAVGNKRGTMVNALLWHCKDLSGVGGQLRPGIVHRLDKDTSGLLVAAKDDYTHKRLSDQFKKRTTRRKYIAFVKGVVQLDNGTIDLPIGRHKRQREKMAVSFTEAKDAITHYKVLKRYDNYTMLELELGTGRTHQIRAHMEYLGHSLLGDKKYGKASNLIERHALHAAMLGFKHPVTKKMMEFKSEMPDDMKRLL